jgi:tRNA-splicing ligase RtcB (3'-phosphate/5'-hydroxy nucleic acid ligase)
VAEGGQYILGMSYDGPQPREVKRGVFEIEPHGAMRAPVRMFATRRLMPAMTRDDSLRQACNVACLPGLVGSSLVMPDMHQGYGFPIGGVAAFDGESGIVSPGGVGYDINCGVRLIRTDLEVDGLARRLDRLAEEIARSVPAGVGSSGATRALSRRDLDRVLREGAGFAVSRGFGEPEDLAFIESGGRLDGADPDAVSDRAHERGATQLGTVGSGNHFIELQKVEQVFRPDAAELFGLFAGQLVVMLHSGSRGLGYQVCDDSLKTMLRASRDYGVALPDPQLTAVPIASPEGRQYLAAMRAAANYAWANRQTMMGLVERAVSRVMEKGRLELGFRLVWDLAHNIAKAEEHEVEGRRRSLLVHRKGATRAFPMGHGELPPQYRSIGQPVLVPGDMGRASYVCVAGPAAMELSWGSCAHGAGREMSRHAALKAARGRDIFDEMAQRGVTVHAHSKRTVAEEMPEAYKDVTQVVEAVELAGIARGVARLRPLAVIKG